MGHMFCNHTDFNIDYAIKQVMIAKVSESKTSSPLAFAKSDKLDTSDHNFSNMQKIEDQSGGIEKPDEEKITFEQK